MYFQVPYNESLVWLTGRAQCRFKSRISGLGEQGFTSQDILPVVESLWAKTKVKKDLGKTSAPRVPMWSPTMVLTERYRA